MAQTDGDAPRELFLIDGNSLAYRAFFALPESIATSDGRPDQRDLRLRVDAREDPHRLRRGADRGGLGRRDVGPQGALGRLQGAAHAAAPTCSSSSGRTCARWSRRSATATSRVEGFEADDVIAALVEQAREREIPVMVVTGDRDAYQLVGDGVRIMTTSPRDHRHEGLRPPRA